MKKGFIALLSSIIISLTLLLAVLGASQFGMTGRFILLHTEEKSLSSSAARSCLEVARIAILNDALYEISDREVYLLQHTCKIISILANTPQTGKSTIKVQGNVNGAVTNIEAVINASTGAYISIQELPSL